MMKKQQIKTDLRINNDTIAIDEVKSYGR